MSGLSAFMAQNAIKVENVKYVASKRFVDEDTKKPMEWELRAMTSDEDEMLRRECMRKVQVPGKRGQYTAELDSNLYVGKMVARCVVFPNLNDKELQDSYNVMGADALLKKMLIGGEYTDLIVQVQKINGFEESIDDMVEDAKN